MHEYLWYLERENGVTNSARARRNVARYFAENFEIKAISKKLEDGDYSCHGEGVHFLMSKIPSTSNCLLSFSAINGARVFSNTTAQITNCDNYQFEEVEPEPGRTYDWLYEILDVIDEATGMASHKLTWSNRYTETLPVKMSLSVEVKNLEFPGFNSKAGTVHCLKENGWRDSEWD